MNITLHQAQRVIDAALKQARADGAQPLAVVVLDSGGHVVASAREDHASLFRHEIAHAKAMGALGMGADTRTIAGRAVGNASFYQSLTAAVGGQIAFSPGGVLIRDADGLLIGAVGISGDTGDCDEVCAIAGIVAAGLLHGAKA
ncbi:heme-binding protein [Sphingomonas sp. MG17]|uniref:Heme-binding protein n=1 Tax=Sphingomonas tagetis TaxID=2949092 RepID=A0A9X2HMW1_9SPHN|nr:heme-binding protein [Sphingomonas tagetis]MCP3730263.1 heme-binding protein [Sphingomonas tagetis]